MDTTLRYLLFIRLVVIGGQVVALIAMDRIFGVAVPWPAVSLILLLLAALTGGTWLLRSSTGRDQRLYLFHSSADIVALSALVYFTGGAFNPFISLFLLPIVFAAAAMPPASTAGITLLAGTCYTALMFIQPAAPQVDVHLHGHLQGDAGRFDLHVWGMWYGFVLSAVCVALFVARIARRQRVRDRELADLREAALENERMLALGTLAAGTAHELGTPLSTIAILAGELAETAVRPVDRDQLRRLQQQVARCKEILSRMAAGAGNLRAESGQRVDLANYLETLVADWHQRRPEVHLAQIWNGQRPAPSIVADRVIGQAIVNVLDNAADAASRQVTVRGTWDEHAFELAVDDDGEGIAPDIRARIGREALTTKADGMGIGLLLSRSIVERLGGTLALDVRPRMGTSARITLPLAPLSLA